MSSTLTDSINIVQFHDIFLQVFKSGTIEKNVQNAFKINRLFLDVLTPVLRTYLESYIINRNPSFNHFFYELIQYVNSELRTRRLHPDRLKALKDIERTLDETIKKNLDLYPNDLKPFDIKFLGSIARNFLRFHPSSNNINEIFDQRKFDDWP